MKYLFEKKACLLFAAYFFSSVEWVFAQEGVNLDAEEENPNASPSLWQTMKSSAETMSSELEKKAADGLEYTKQTLGEYSEFKTEKAKEVVSVFNDNIKVIEEAGFSVDDLYVSLSLVPVVTAKFKQVKQLSDNELSKLLEKYQDKPLLIYILRTLHKAYGMSFSNYQVADVSVRASIPPSTTIHLRRVD